MKKIIAITISILYPSAFENKSRLLHFSTKCLWKNTIPISTLNLSAFEITIPISIQNSSIFGLGSLERFWSIFVSCFVAWSPSLTNVCTGDRCRVSLLRRPRLTWLHQEIDWQVPRNVVQSAVLEATQVCILKIVKGKARHTGEMISANFWPSVQEAANERY